MVYFALTRVAASDDAHCMMVSIAKSCLLLPPFSSPLIFTHLQDDVQRQVMPQVPRSDPALRGLQQSQVQDVPRLLLLELLPVPVRDGE